MNNVRRRTSIQFNRDVIGSLDPVERWNRDNLSFSSGNIISSINGLYNGFNFTPPTDPPFFDNVNGYIRHTDPDLSIINNGVNNANFLSTTIELYAVINTTNAPTGNPILTIGNNSNNRINFFYNTSGRSPNNTFVILSDDGTRNYIIADNIIAGGNDVIVCFLGNGTEYKIFINDPVNDENLIIDEGFNDGKMYVSQTAILQINNFFGTAIRNTNIYDLTFFNKELTSQQRQSVFNELNNIYNVY